MTATRAQTARADLVPRLVVRSVLGLTVVNAILFGLAGRLDWRAAWVVSAMFAIYIGAAMTWFMYRDPDLMKERITRAENVPRWDRVIRLLYGLCLGGLLATAALDAGRVRWSQVPASVQFAGALGIAASFSVIWWCTAVNHYLSSESRLQFERGHRVVRDGPYRIVRHPMYASLIVLMVSIALLLGSWLALAPALAIGVLLAVRTWLEDRMLTRELPGYREYALDVRQRLVPGIW